MSQESPETLASVLARLGAVTVDEVLDSESRMWATAYLMAIADHGVITPTPVHSADDRVFLSTTLENRTFTAFMAHDNDLYVSTDFGTPDALEARLGAASIHWFPKNQSYSICNRSADQPLVPLKGLSHAAVRTLAVVFGMPIHGHPAAPTVPGVTVEALFCESYAFTQLYEWAMAFPRRVTKLKNARDLPWVADRLKVFDSHQVKHNDKLH